MAVNRKVKKEDFEKLVPDENLRKEYKEQNGYMVLDLVGKDEELDEIRENNRRFKKLLGTTTIEEAVAKLEELKDIDPELYRDLKAQQEKMQGKEMIEQGKVEELIEKRVSAATDKIKKQYEPQVSEEREKNKTLTTRLEQVLIEEKIASIAPTKGVKGEAIEDAQTYAKKFWRIVDGHPVCFENSSADADEVTGDDGKRITIEAWFDKLTGIKKHWFEPSEGAGGGGQQRQGKAGQFTGDNPWQKGPTENLTKQGQIVRNNPELARKLMKQAGVKVTV